MQRPGMGMAGAMAGMGQQMQRPGMGMAGAMAGVNKNMQNAQAQMLNQQAINAHGEPAVTDFYNKLMQNQQNPMAQHAGAMRGVMQEFQGQQNPMAQHAGAAQQMMRGVQGMQPQGGQNEMMQKLGPALAQMLMSGGLGKAR